MFEFIIGAALGLMQDEPAAPIHPCAHFRAASAPLEADNRLCGLSIHEGDVRVHYPDGRVFTAGPAPSRPPRIVDAEVQQFWVMRRGDAAFLGVRGPMNEAVSVVVRNEQRGWYTEALQCGRTGPDHIFGWSETGEYALAASYDENYGRLSFCMVNMWRGGLEDFSIEVDYGPDYNRLQIEWLPCRSESEYGPSCMTFSVRDADGRELIRTTP